ncbi:pyroglutamyl-peptidase I [Emydomyces testavorans]|uniref:Pyroglutamyl-peptidase I n=1 Tax=Emydomyces testavorans TaxID=2070801 RepID=A0AAF0IIW4_9EURO|nr:pyroglutamyl-peptidase I [Emydomyces testavorans]
MGDFGADLPPEATLPLLKIAEPIAAEEDIHVLVTGFGPFKTNPLNPSFLIASSLPATTPAPSSSNPKRRTIRIHSHPSPLRVSYSNVRVGIPTIMECFKRAHDGQPPDFVIHIGMASTRHYYSVETRAHRDGYRVTDVDGQVGYEDGEAVWKREGLPEVLSPGPVATEISCVSSSITSAPPTRPAASKLPIHIHPSPPEATFLETWRSFLPATTDLRLSEDAGRYLCEFIYYSSLAYAYKEGRARSVVFLHVPGWTDQASVEKGKDVVIGLIKTLVSCWLDHGVN